MKISFKGDYALKIVLDLSLHYPNLVQIRDISKRQDIPERFLEQIITQLKGGAYVTTIRGPKGGVNLAKSPADITLGEIIRLIDGTTAPITCVSKSCPTRCNFSTKCLFKKKWVEVREKINEVVDETTFQDMVDETKAMQSEVVLDYSI